VKVTQHVEFAIDNGVQVCFCHPNSPGQRVTNKNTDVPLRQYFPKGTDLSVHDQDALDTVALELNYRPRHFLGWMRPSEAFASAVAIAA
jgi:IS30 family transposase